MNEMVSLGDTAISLHKLQPPKPEVPRSAQIPIFRGGVFWKVKILKVQRSAKISIFSVHGGSGVGGCSGKSKYSKCQDLSKISIRGEGCSGKSKYSKCQDLSKISIWGRGGVLKSQNTQSAKICPNFNLGEGCSEKSKPKVARSVQISIFGGGGVFWTKFQNRGVLSNLVKNFLKPSLLVHHR